MRMRSVGLAMCFSIAVSGSAVLGIDAPAATNGAAVLSNDSFVRVFRVHKTPVVQAKGGALKPALDPAAKDGKPLAEVLSRLPDEKWRAVDFADSTWDRQKAPVESPLPWGGGSSALFTAPETALICLRWKFLVNDLAAQPGLQLALEYVGGVAVYVNGVEVTRKELPAGELKYDVLAAAYPDDLTCMPDGKFVQPNYPGNPLPKEMVPKVEERYRRLEALAIPARLLKAGINVLAIEVHRAPVNEAAVTATRAKEGAMSTQPGLYAYAGVRKIALSTVTGGGVAANVARPSGLQVWPVKLHDTLRISEYDDAPGLSPDRPIRITAARNGVFSGRLVVSADETIRGFHAVASDLKQPGGAALAGTNVLLRYAQLSDPARTMRVPRDRFDGLSETIPAEIPAVNRSAMCPLWLTVKVPATAAPGTYKGTVSLTADGAKPATVPVEVTVHAWTLPNPKDFHLHNFGYVSEDAISKHYNVPRWSDKHFQLMGKSLALMAEVNSRQAIVNLAISFYGGHLGDPKTSNEETMVRWVRQADGSFRYDFTQFDKYLDMVGRSIGKPDLLRVNCWNEVTRKDQQVTRFTDSKGVPVPNYSVSVLDPATGKLSTLEPPTPGTEEATKFWRPVLEELRKKAEARGWWDVTALGWSSYCSSPLPEVVSMAKSIWPDGVWSYTAHNGTRGQSFACVEKGTGMKLLHADSLWTAARPRQRGFTELLKPHYGYWCYTWRSNMREYGDLAVFRIIPEDEIMRGQDGVSDFGVDLFPVRSENGGRYYVPGNGRGTGGPEDSIYALLAPGPDGAISSERFENLREGMEIAEAILSLQLALDSKKLPPELEKKINDHLTARGEAFLRNWTSGRIEQDAELFALAAEAAQGALPR